MTNSLAISSLYNDPYFMQALNSPNYYQLQQAQQSATQTQTPTTADTATSSTNATNPTFQGKAAESTGSGTGVAVALTAAAAIGGTALWILNRGKGKGAKGIVDQFKKGIESFKKEKNVYEIRKINDKYVFSLPNKSEVYRGADISTKNNALGLGIDEGLKWTDKAAKVKGYHINITGSDGIANRITVRDGKVVSCVNLSKKAGEEGRLFTDAYNNGTLDTAFKKQIDDAILAMNKRDMTSIPSGVDIKNIVYHQTTDGANALFLANAEKTGVTNGVKVVKTNRFELNDEKLKAAREENEGFNQIVANITGKKSKIDGLDISYATCTPSGLPAGHEIVIKNNAIKGVNVTGSDAKTKFYDINTDTYKALHFDNKEIIDKVLANNTEFKNVAYSYAA